ncbi:MAG: hypothetical protein AAGB05_13530, partial [Pseudomonadota bacterium]
DDADVCLFERNIEAYKKLHSLNSLIDCDARHGQDVCDWRKARSAHLYQQSEIFARAGIALHQGLSADWIGNASVHRIPVVDRPAEALTSPTRRSLDDTTVLCPTKAVKKASSASLGPLHATTKGRAVPIRPARC